jgi:hypothetical protein
MGFFDKLTGKSATPATPEHLGNCFLCGQPLSKKAMLGVSYNTAVPLADGKHICQHCKAQKALKIKSNTTSQNVLTQIKENGMLLPEQFAPTINVQAVTIIGGMLASMTDFIEIDESRKLIVFPVKEKTGLISFKQAEHLRKFEDLIDFDLQVDGSTVTDGSSLLGAAVGALSFGGVGAIVGSGMRAKETRQVITKMNVNVRFNDMNNPQEVISILDGFDCKKGSQSYETAYNKAQEIISLLTVILQKNKGEQQNAANDQSLTADVADEIMKFKKLLDAGAITQEEFDAKKKQLLEL